MANEADPAAGPPAASDDAASLPPGTTLADYVIERPLGGGGFGITYLARDSNLQLPVAIKEYFPSELVTRGSDNSVCVRAANPDHQSQYDWGLERFLDEARALATFRHPNIVRVLRYFKGNGTAYIVMEYESGLSLKRWLPQNLPLSQKALLAIIYPVLDGLEAVHNTGFLHRDIKPDNIYVRADGTPVLLDFGAARRVSTNQELTNIVSPGYAPFEQYHSQGNQGPWTDIYSIGAVMYWMTTGRKPVESAARVKQDSMLPATGLADAGVFGDSLLQAIDWALQPDEAKRPQNIAILRAAVQGSEKIDTGSVDIEIVPDKPNVTSPPSQRRNLVCTIMFLDLVGYSKRSVEDQAAIKKLFNDTLAKSLKGVPDDARIAIDTGDGAAICFLGDPEEALNSALLLRDLLGQRRALSLRTGLHMGPVRVINDINARVNVIGDGINVAQRIMDFAQSGQVLVSRSYYDVISRITDDTADLFQYMGQYEDKHGRLHEVYAVGHQKSGDTRVPNTKREGPSTGYTRTQPSALAKPLAPEEIHDVEAELARHIGPLAKVLVKKAAALAPTVVALREALAPSIQEDKARAAFIAGANSQSHPDSQPLSNKRQATKPPSQFGGLAPNIPVVSRSSNKSVPFGSAPSKNFSVPTSPSKLSPHPQLELEAAEAAAIEQALSKYIGPMAKMIVRKEASRNANFKDFLTAVAGNIDQQTQRDQFLAALKRSLVRRY